jgi:CRP-like cAMP-binding protein
MINAKECFKEYYHFSDEEIAELWSSGEQVIFDQGSAIVKENEINSSLYIILKGIVRCFSFNYVGDEVTQWFADTGMIIFSSWSYVNDQPSKISLEALTDCELLCIKKSYITSMTSKSNGYANLIRKLIEQHYFLNDNWMVQEDMVVTKERNITAKERYLSMISEMPALLAYTPLHQIASYLRITPQSLSRIRAEICKKTNKEGAD